MYTRIRREKHGSGDGCQTRRWSLLQAALTACEANISGAFSCPSLRVWRGHKTPWRVGRALSRQDLIQLPQHGSRSITHHANFFLQRAWRSKDLSPLIKTFTWRLIRRALATGERQAGTV
jgi:hypothetical protein